MDQKNHGYCMKCGSLPKQIYNQSLMARSSRDDRLAPNMPGKPAAEEEVNDRRSQNRILPDRSPGLASKHSCGDSGSSEFEWICER